MKNDQMRREELWERLRQRLDGGAVSLPTDEELMRELMPPAMDRGYLAANYPVALIAWESGKA